MKREDKILEVGEVLGFSFQQQQTLYKITKTQKVVKSFFFFFKSQFSSNFFCTQFTFIIIPSMTRIGKKKFGLRIHHNFFLEFLRKITSREIQEIFTIFFLHTIFLKSEREEGKIAGTNFCFVC